MLPSGPLFVSFYQGESGPWGVVCTQHATPNAIRSAMTTWASSNGFTVELVQVPEKPPISVVDIGIAMSGAQQTLIVVFANDPEMAKQHLIDILSGRVRTYSEQLSTPQRYRLEKIESDVMIQVSNSNGFMPEIKDRCGLVGALNH